MTRLLLCTDLDRTLIPNGKQPESDNARALFRKLVNRPEVVLTYVTGRDQTLVEAAIQEYDIPKPDFVIADVGASIFQLNNTAWQIWDLWEKSIEQDWGGYKHADLVDLLSDYNELKLQEASKQGKYKLSYYISLDVSQNELITSIKNRLLTKKIHTNIVWSIDEAENIGLLDILPGQAGKQKAIEFLRTQLSYHPHELVFAGDSGNDICVMASPIQSILVANASNEVKMEAKKQAKANNCLDQLYFAKGNFYGLNGNYSGGILEGVAHYIIESEQWLWKNQ